MNVDVDVRVPGPVSDGDTLGIEWEWENVEGALLLAPPGTQIRLVVTVTSMGQSEAELRGDADPASG